MRGTRLYRLKQLHKNKYHVTHNTHRNLFTLENGDIVRRCLTDGDEVMVNRQPTLAKTNILFHKVRITRNTKSISLNISMTDNYAADCDGDEMNVFLGHTSDLSGILATSQRNVIFNKNGKVATRLKQDGMRVAYTLSLPHWYFTLNEVQNILPRGCRLPPPIITRPRELWSGRQLLSLALPRGLVVDTIQENDDNNEEVKVKCGQFLCGKLNKSGQERILNCCRL